MAKRDRRTSKTPYKFTLHVTDHIADTMHLSAAQHGAYLRLLFSYWRSGPPPDDDRVLARIAGVTVSEWREIRPAVEPFFQVDAGRWVHYQVDAELEAAYAAINKASKAGKVAAEARWNRDREQQPRDRDRSADDSADALRPNCVVHATRTAAAFHAASDSQFQQKYRGTTPYDPRPSQDGDSFDSAHETGGDDEFAVDLAAHDLCVGGVQ